MDLKKFAAEAEIPNIENVDLSKEIEEIDKILERIEKENEYWMGL